MNATDKPTLEARAERTTPDGRVKLSPETFGKDQHNAILHVARSAHYSGEHNLATYEWALGEWSPKRGLDSKTYNTLTKHVTSAVLLEKQLGGVLRYDPRNDSCYLMMPADTTVRDLQRALRNT
jgi:hypothetical protein